MSDQPNVIAIVGVGLLGGSIAAAVKERNPGTQVVGIGRNQTRLAQAAALGLLDSFHTDINGIADADIIVICTPVDRIVEDVRNAAEVAKPGALITDVGSVKRTIVTGLLDLAAAGTFVGSHPMAGSEKSGFEHADPNLFVDANCIVCPTEVTPSTATATIIQFWQDLGSNTTSMPPEEHDKIVATISHLPHAVAAALARTPDTPALPFAATGFADTTRIASGDPGLWAAIFAANREEVMSAIDQFKVELNTFRNAMESETEMFAYLQQACSNGQSQGG
ncbi:MAG: prephenate dehydrogenase [Planctomycetaceae bacterium]